MPAAGEVLRILGPAGGLLVIALAVAVVTLWKALNKAVETIAHMNSLMAAKFTATDASLVELRSDVRDGFSDVLAALRNR